jgi:hypothetical protein
MSIENALVSLIGELEQDRSLVAAKAGDKGGAMAGAVAVWPSRTILFVFV